MSSGDPSPPFEAAPAFPNGMALWPQFPMGNESSSFHIDPYPPFKRHKSSDDLSPENSRIARINPVVNQPTGRIFFKTRLCAKFRMGQCRNGENCNFAHGEEDLRKPPPNWQDLVGGRTEDRGGGGVAGGNWNDDDQIIHRMKICKKYYNGEDCPYGDKCNFLHKEPARFREPASVPGRIRDVSSRESSAISIGTTGPPMMQQTTGYDQYTINRVGEVGSDGSRGNVKPVYWKTKICTKWEITGHCPFGEKCHFAHGQSDLQLFGVQMMEGESANLTPGTPKASHPAPIIELIGAANNVEAMWVAPNKEELGKNNLLLKWKGRKKINRIYADWIDDLPLNLCNEADG